MLAFGCGFAKDKLQQRAAFLDVPIAIPVTPVNTRSNLYSFTGLQMSQVMLPDSVTHFFAFSICLTRRAAWSRAIRGRRSSADNSVSRPSMCGGSEISFC